jgi:nitroreductase
MNVSTAIAARHSTRAFQETPVPSQVLRKVITNAAAAPSGGNLQPWHIHVIAGDRMVAFKAIMRRELTAPDVNETPEYDIYPNGLISPYRERRYAVGEALYAAIGIPRDDKASRLKQLAKNFEFFGAPAGLFCFVHRSMGAPQWSDLGMYLQNVMLLLTQEGLASCSQECWAAYPRTVSRYLGVGAELILFCGMSIGYEDADAPINQFRAARAPIEEVATFHGL